MSTSCYVYYRVAASDFDRVASRVKAMQARLRQETGVAGRLLRRAEDAATWMEVYEGVADAAAFEAALARLAREFGVDALLAEGGRRHLERFVPCA